MAVDGFEPTRLTLARRRRGWSRAELAKRAKLAPRTINAYEGGEKAPGAEARAALVQALGFPDAFFGGDPVEHLDKEAVTFRALSRTTKSTREKALSAVSLAFILADRIADEFNLPALNLPDLHPTSEPEVAAEALRVHWGLGDKPIANMVQLLEAHGVRVFSLAENTRDIDGISTWRGNTPYVFLNTLKSPERSRFDAAHELGHIVLHRHGVAAGRHVEHEANAFASAFLMPKSSVFAHVPGSRTVTGIVAAKRVWGISTGALAHRLHRLGLLTDWHYTMLCKQIQAAGYRDEEPNSMPRELSAIWPQVFWALKERNVSRADYARGLSFPLDELRGLVFQLVLSADPSNTLPHAKSAAPLQLLR